MLKQIMKRINFLKWLVCITLIFGLVWRVYFWIIPFDTWMLSDGRMLRYCRRDMENPYSVGFAVSPVEAAEIADKYCNDTTINAHVIPYWILNDEYIFSPHRGTNSMILKGVSVNATSGHARLFKDGRAVPFHKYFLIGDWIEPSHDK